MATDRSGAFGDHAFGEMAFGEAFGEPFHAFQRAPRVPWYNGVAPRVSRRVSSSWQSGSQARRRLALSSQRPATSTAEMQASQLADVAASRLVRFGYAAPTTALGPARIPVAWAAETALELGDTSLAFRGGILTERGVPIARLASVATDARVRVSWSGGAALIVTSRIPWSASALRDLPRGIELSAVASLEDGYRLLARHGTAIEVAALMALAADRDLAQSTVLSLDRVRGVLVARPFGSASWRFFQRTSRRLPWSRQRLVVDDREIAFTVGLATQIQVGRAFPLAWLDTTAVDLVLEVTAGGTRPFIVNNKYVID